MDHHSDNKYLIGEATGAAILLYVVCQSTDVTVVSAVVAVLTLVFTPVCGAHLNPAVTTGLHFAYGDESFRS